MPQIINDDAKKAGATTYKELADRLEYYDDDGNVVGVQKRKIPQAANGATPPAAPPPSSSGRAPRKVKSSERQAIETAANGVGTDGDFNLPIEGGKSFIRGLHDIGTLVTGWGEQPLLGAAEMLGGGHLPMAGDAQEETNALTLARGINRGLPPLELDFESSDRALGVVQSGKLAKAIEDSDAAEKEWNADNHFSAFRKYPGAYAANKQLREIMIASDFQGTMSEFKEGIKNGALSSESLLEAMYAIREHWDEERSYFNPHILAVDDSTKEMERRFDTANIWDGTFWAEDEDVNETGNRTDKAIVGISGALGAIAGGGVTPLGGAKAVGTSIFQKGVGLIKGSVDRATSTGALIFGGVAGAGGSSDEAKSTAEISSVLGAIGSWSLGKLLRQFDRLGKGLSAADEVMEITGWREKDIEEILKFDAALKRINIEPPPAAMWVKDKESARQIAKLYHEADGFKDVEKEVRRIMKAARARLPERVDAPDSATGASGADDSLGIRASRIFGDDGLILKQRRAASAPLKAEMTEWIKLNSLDAAGEAIEIKTKGMKASPLTPEATVQLFGGAPPESVARVLSAGMNPKNPFWAKRVTDAAKKADPGEIEGTTPEEQLAWLTESAKKDSAHKALLNSAMKEARAGGGGVSVADAIEAMRELRRIKRKAWNDPGRQATLGSMEKELRKGIEDGVGAGGAAFLRQWDAKYKREVADKYYTKTAFMLSDSKRMNANAVLLEKADQATIMDLIQMGGEAGDMGRSLALGKVRNLGVYNDGRWTIDGAAAEKWVKQNQLIMQDPSLARAVDAEIDRGMFAGLRRTNTPPLRKLLSSNQDGAEATANRYRRAAKSAGGMDYLYGRIGRELVSVIEEKGEGAVKFLESRRNVLGALMGDKDKADDLIALSRALKWGEDWSRELMRGSETVQRSTIFNWVKQKFGLSPAQFANWGRLYALNRVGGFYFGGSVATTTGQRTLARQDARRVIAGLNGAALQAGLDNPKQMGWMARALEKGQNKAVAKIFAGSAAFAASDASGVNQEAAVNRLEAVGDGIFGDDFGGS